MLEFGFVCSIKYPSLFIYTKGKNIIIILRYMDNILLVGNNAEVLTRLLDDLNNCF